MFRRLVKIFSKQPLKAAWWQAAGNSSEGAWGSCADNIGALMIRTLFL